MDPSNVQSPRLGRRSTLVEENYERVTHSPSGRAIPLRVQIDSVLTKIAELTSLNSHQPAEDFKQFETLKLKLEQLENLQRDQRFPSRPPPSTEQANKLDFEEFENWLVQNGVNLGPYKLSYSNLEGKGLTATEYIKQDTLLFNIPKKLMLTTTTASECPITSELISKDPMLKAIPSLRLVIHLLVERFKEHKSFWNAYINLLPKVNYTPLEFNLEELLYLKGSLTMVEIIKLTKRAAKQYLHFYSILENYGESTFILTKRNFTWAAFKWALITVMSRQNPLPFAPNGESPHTGLGLVPLWDLCNHEHGQITTFYNPETESLESSAMQTFQAGDPIRMHYGNRPNIDFFLYSGFCQPKITEFDRLPISLAILDQNDPLSFKRKKLCQLLRLPTSNTFQLVGAPILENSKPLMRFLVIQVLPEADIESLLEQTPDLAPNLAASLGREGLKDRNQAEILLDNKLQDTKCLKHVIQWLLIKLKVQFRFLSGTIKNDEYILNTLSPSLPSSFPTIFILKMKFIEYAQLELIISELESLIKDLMLNQSKSFSSANSSLLI